ncbi:disease resistance protein [Senna tora]|uniref:Disease resistance protein n=1 Tax=Senna tora TaxID=362788 RepID=A0A834X011_9FABA|nr:disease resistance protein [Senna tora]
MDIEEGLRNPYSCLKLSYDNLRNSTAKSLFLLCSIFPEDYNIKKEDLLTNLHTLCLRGNALGDISFLVTLGELEILNLRGSSFDELPISIADKKKLKLLDLYKCSIKKSPYEVIGKCSQLQELYIEDEESPSPENVTFPTRLQRYALCVSLIGGEGIFELNVENNGDPITHLKLNSNMSNIRLWRCPELEFIWKGPDI